MVSFCVCASVGVCLWSGEDQELLVRAMIRRLDSVT